MPDGRLALTGAERKRRHDRRARDGLIHARGDLPPDLGEWLIDHGFKADAAAATIGVIIAAGAVSWLRPWEPDVEPAVIARMAHPLPDRPSIAVLPFTNMSGDASQDPLADGIAEDITTDLSQISGLFVVARNSAFTFKSTLKDPSITLSHIFAGAFPFACIMLVVLIAIIAFPWLSLALL